MEHFEWIESGCLIDDDLELVIEKKVSANPAKGFVPAYHFEMRVANSTKRVGRITIRVGDTYYLSMYSGHVGYEVEPDYRGRHYAARSFSLLIPLMKQHGMKELWITCNPENMPSRRTCELIGAEFVEIVNLPEDHDLYHDGERRVCRYRLGL